LNVSEAKFAFNKFTEKKIIDLTTNGDRIYVLLHDEFLVYDLNTQKAEFYSLTNLGIQPTRLNINRQYLFIGYINGTVEIRKSNNGFPSVRITSDQDMGGPGDRSVVNSSLAKYFFVNTKETGLLIYSHPTFLNTKWIMIGLETTIAAYSYYSEFLYVLTSENEVHMLDFANSILIEIPVRSYPYFDLYFDGEYLFMIYKHGIHIYEAANKHRMKNFVKTKMDPSSVFVIPQRHQMIDERPPILILNSDKIMRLLWNGADETEIRPMANLENKIISKFKERLNFSYVDTSHRDDFIAHLTLLTEKEIIKYSIFEQK